MYLFRYPNTRTDTLYNITLNIYPGETITIIGKNGSGKSTLIKVILGIYEPIAGKVEIGGLDTKKADMNSLFHNVSAVFQNYQRYKMILLENIDISDNKLCNMDDIKLIINKVGLDIKSNIFPDGYKTMLSRDFDGVELSGGQWQRIAIARGLYRTHDFIVLDEPTAAIDPIEEANLYKKFTEISKDKTSIIITHRLGSAKIADKILVMENGELIEIGIHDELMKRKGHYYTMFCTQVKWYI
jgi:ATP-binding cassette subfamily B protein